jgi:hypothetical protein
MCILGKSPAHADRDSVATPRQRSRRIHVMTVLDFLAVLPLTGVIGVALAGLDTLRSTAALVPLAILVARLVARGRQE